ncbi:MAG TPA: hypothetical protein VNA89_13545 [Gemmatimonadaceae bacterium]|nr:hypothetical protein [Gemmatimonadaceae bacterium]
MSGATGLDLRYPIGALFTVLGVVVGGYGLATAGDAALYARSLSVNINVWWGAVMLVFGAALLLAARRASRSAGARPAAASPEGRATEAREKRTGLER